MPGRAEYCAVYCYYEPGTEPDCIECLLEYYDLDADSAEAADLISILHDDQD